jgi:alpha-D-ribose 1-methylphosphonate 5-triphosphate synthase subunit PhnH
MNSAMVSNRWRHGYDNTASGSHQAFRAILDAMEHPGSLVTVPEYPHAPAVFNSSAAATCLTLLDSETPVWTDIEWRNPAISWLQFVCGSSIVTEISMAKFVIITKPAVMPSLEFFRVGRHELQEKATTILVQVDDIYPVLDNRSVDMDSGPAARLKLKGVAETFRYQWRRLSLLYPLGMDIFFTCDDVLTAWPKIQNTPPAMRR